MLVGRSETRSGDGRHNSNNTHDGTLVYDRCVWKGPGSRVALLSLVLADPESGWWESEEMLEPV